MSESIDNSNTVLSEKNMDLNNSLSKEPVNNEPSDNEASPANQENTENIPETQSKAQIALEIFYKYSDTESNPITTEIVNEQNAKNIHTEFQKIRRKKFNQLVKEFDKTPEQIFENENLLAKIELFDELLKEHGRFGMESNLLE